MSKAVLVWTKTDFLETIGAMAHDRHVVREMKLVRLYQEFLHALVAVGGMMLMNSAGTEFD